MASNLGTQRLAIDAEPSLTHWRDETPGCARRNHLNNAGAALMPEPVIRAITDHLTLEANIGGYEAAAEREKEVDHTYEAIASLVGSAPRNIAITSSATAAFIQAMSSFDFAPGDVIVTSRCDYTSNQLHYLSLARRHEVRIVRAQDQPEGGVDPDSVRALVRELAPRLVAISWVPTNSGLVQDVAAIGEVCEQSGTCYLIDACQAVGQLPIDVEQLHCDYLSATARKFLRGPRGIGFLYVADRALNRGDYPLYVDMRGAMWEAPDDFSLVPDARRFEDWEFPYALVLGLGAAAEYANTAGVERIGTRAVALAELLRSRLARLDPVRVLDRGRDRCAIVTASVDGWDAPALVEQLRRRHINVSASLRWYGLLDMTEKGVESAVRFSPHYYNTTEELDAAVDAVAEIVATR
ncbi:MAG: aminotransferase class V-fold PLP-dependent enzyme [Gemmatimonadota bacterium]|nr:aminotransferase class V-fold PLP-dependent enzyme [Gemmatimonadota bacterium]